MSRRAAGLDAAAGGHASACPLCGCPGVRIFATVNDRHYLRCRTCALVHLEASHRLPVEAERRVYEMHRNHPGDRGYRDFLDRLALPLAERLAPGACGLDYGCGPGPTLWVMLRERGFPMEIYDPLFAPENAPLARTYDFVTCTETVEHFFHPGRELETLDGLLRPGGWLAIMTSFMPDEKEQFASWHYVRDPTHVSFYSRATMQWIAASFGWAFDCPCPTVALFNKPSRVHGAAVITGAQDP